MEENGKLEYLTVDSIVGKRIPAIIIPESK